MGLKKKQTEELTKVFQHIKEKMAQEDCFTAATSFHLLSGIIECKDNTAYEMLQSNMQPKDIEELKKELDEHLVATELPKRKTFTVAKEVNDAIKSSYRIMGSEKVAINEKPSLLQVLYLLLSTDKTLCKTFQNHYKLDLSTILRAAKDGPFSVEEMLQNPDKEKDRVEQLIKAYKESKKQQRNSASSNKDASANEKFMFFDLLPSTTNLTKMAAEGKIEKAVGNDKIIDDIFRILSKRNKNNVILVGDPGVGKTITVRHIANRIVMGRVPKTMKYKQLFYVDTSLIPTDPSGRPFFENHATFIVNKAKTSGSFIVFIDDIHTITSSNRYGESDAIKLLNPLLNDRSIMLICATTHKGYSNFIGCNPSVVRKIQKVTMDEPTQEMAVKIINESKHKYEHFHNVAYSNDVITECVDLSKRYITDRLLPDSAMDILDEAGAMANISKSDSKVSKDLQNELLDLQDTKEAYKKYSLHKDYDVIDELTKKIIDVNTKIKLEEKRVALENRPTKLSMDVVKQVISKKTGVQLEDIKSTEKERLRSLNDELKKVVIGQDEAIDEVCKVVKRQRVGLASPDKPSVLFFGGSTGTGKSYLAKKLAEKVFGGEDKLVKLDMSEYADKTSVTKLYGSSAGYVGYEEGGILTERIKKNKFCVLLLDEIEKANEEVFNVFLQLFDEGRMTDNKGTVVDFKNVIVIMTSNVGAAEMAGRGGGIGFVKDKNSMGDSIFKRALKKQFKPEFINRIDKIVFFNTLSDENIKSIIKLEIDKVEEKLKKIGYGLDETAKGQEMIDKLFILVREDIDYGARPVVRIVRSEIEDKITDLIINFDYKNGYAFGLNDLR